MDIKKIISIGGKSGLYKVIGQSGKGVIVESLEDGKRFPAYASNQISALSDISIYTDEGEEPLAQVFQKIFEKYPDGLKIDAKADSKTLRDFFLEILPTHDQERVYASDIKKVVKWYQLLLGHGFFTANTESNSDEELVSDAEIIDESIDEQPTDKTENTEEKA